MRLSRVYKTILKICAVTSLLPVLGPARRFDPQETAEPYTDFHAESWVQADRVFRQDPRWLGGDAAYSVDLGGQRVLWLFQDSFIARRAGAGRGHSTMVRNSVAIETGYDPSRAALKFYWRTQKGRPASFVPERGDTWLWPTHGVQLGQKLLLFFTKVRRDKQRGSLGFQNFGWAAFLIDNPDEEPSAWVLHRIDVPSNPWNVIVGAAVLISGDYLDVFSPAEPSHDIYLVRWPLNAAAHGDLASPEWWCGPEKGWTGQRQIVHAPLPVFLKGSMEFSVQRDAQGSKFLAVESVGFGASEIAIRWADRLEGPWSAARRVFVPPESQRPDGFVYAAKSHPELTGADLVITYVANSFDFGILTRDLNIYYPRFVRLWFSQRLGVR